MFVMPKKVFALPKDFQDQPICQLRQLAHLLSLFWLSFASAAHSTVFGELERQVNHATAHHHFRFWSRSSSDSFQKF